MPTLDLIEKALERSQPFQQILITISLPLMTSKAVLREARGAGVIDFDRADLPGLNNSSALARQIEIRPNPSLYGSRWIGKLADIIERIEPAYGLAG